MTSEERKFCEILIGNGGICHTSPCSLHYPWVKNGGQRSVCTEKRALTWARELIVLDTLQNLPEHIFNPFNI